MIPATIRARIGTTELRPVWHLYDDTGRAGDPDKHPALPPGATVSLDMSATDAPSRSISIASVLARPRAALWPNGTWQDAGAEDTTAPLPLTSVMGRRRITAGWATPDGTEYVEEMGIYHPDHIEHAGQHPTVTLSSSEVLVIGRTDQTRTPTGTVPNWPPASVLAFVQRVMANAVTKTNRVTVVQDAAPLYTPSGDDAWGYTNGVELWSQLVGVLQAAQLRLNVADDGTWHLVRATRTAGTPVATILDGPGGTLIDVKGTSEQASATHAIIVEYKWTDTAGNERSTRSTGGFMADWISSQVTVKETRNHPATQAMADQYAKSRLAALQTLDNQRTITAVMMPWVRPDDTVAYRVGTVTWAGIVTDISFNLTNGTMTLTLRGITIINGAG